MTPLADNRARWLAQLKSTEPADRGRAEAGARQMASAAGFKEPQHFVWFDSPYAASWALTALVAHAHPWSMTLGSLTREEREKLDQARSALGGVVGTTDPKAIVAAFGQPRLSALVFPPDPRRLFSNVLLDERFALDDEVTTMVRVLNDELEEAEGHFWRGASAVLSSGVYAPTTGNLITQSYLNDHWFSMMADDENRIGGRPTPPFLAATFEVARSAGLWWPFENGVVFCDRPSALHVNERQLLHNANGPALVYRDAWQMYIWNGKAVPERWITDPEAVPPREYKGFDPTFRKHVESRAGSAKATAAAPRKRTKSTSILKAQLPADHAARLTQLREHAGGRLPLLDRYIAGEHEVVWKELVTLGESVREDPHAADALAVAYETMHRVEANVRTLVERLTGIGYRFTQDPATSGGGGGADLSGLLKMFSSVIGSMAQRGVSKPAGKPEPRGHTPPPAGIQKKVADFEKQFGVLPLSLRAFYEVVGEVNLIGTHPSIDPPGNRVAPDPLVVYAIDEGVVEYDHEDEDGEGEPNAITIAPDDLHKANTSGGAPYEMALPDLRADGELLNERHNLFFVDYLRLCFKFGGFPGYEGMGTIPAELERLSADLIPF